MLLELRDLHVRYGRVHAVKGVSINLAPGQIVAVLGANGAGKSSMLRALLGIEKISDGSVHFDGHDITHWTPSRRVANGLVLVPEGRRIVMSLTVHENLQMGAFNRRNTSTIGREIDEIYDRFSNLKARRDRSASDGRRCIEGGHGSRRVCSPQLAAKFLELLAGRRGGVKEVVRPCRFVVLQSRLWHDAHLTQETVRSIFGALLETREPATIPGLGCTADTRRVISAISAIRYSQ